MKRELQAEDLEQALDLIGADLAAAGVVEELLVIGGGCLQLLGLIPRGTSDLDIVARREGGRFVRLYRVPQALQRSLDRARRLLPLPEDLFDVKASSVMAHGLPAGFEGRLLIREYGGLVLHLMGRTDVICLKVHAAADRDPGSKHVQDLRALNATSEELLAGARWAVTQDPSPGFRSVLCVMLRHMGVDDVDDALPAEV